jgi:hypothetical protein
LRASRACVIESIFQPTSVIGVHKLMAEQVADYYPHLKAAIAEAKAVGLEPAASELEAQIFAAYTTSSELLGEQGLAILKFLRSEGGAVPPSVTAKLNACLKEIRKVWPRL